MWLILKKAWKHVAIIFAIMAAIFSISFLFEDKTSYDYISTYEEQPAVYVTKYGDCYHSGYCHYLNQSKIEKGLYEAQDKGYRACSYCGGQSHSTIQVEYREYFKVTDYTNALFYSGLRAVVYAPVLYLIGLWIVQQRKENGEESENHREGIR